MEHAEAIRLLIDGALKSDQGARQVRKAMAHLVAQVTAGRFNSERAVEVYRIAIDRAVVTALAGVPMKGRMFEDYRSSEEGDRKARELAASFMASFEVTDQRPARRWLRFLLGA
jgi:hypothetical protein